MSSPERPVRSRILGTGICLPPRVVPNAEIAPLLEVDEAWIEQRTGIRERRFVNEGIGASDLGVEAANQAIRGAGLTPKDIDFVVFATLTPDFCFPGSSCYLQARLEMGLTPAMDVRNQCTGFLYGLTVADALVLAGQARRVLVVGAEVHSTGLDLGPRGRDLSALFGDGAGAVVIAPAHSPDSGILGSVLHAQGEHADALMCVAPQSSRRPRIDHQMLDQGLHFPVMDGRRVFRHAVQRLEESVKEVLHKTGYSIGDIACFVFHQANLRIVESVANRLNIPNERLFNNIERYGNTTAASIPIALHEAVVQDRIRRGDLVLLAAFGSGFTWGSILLRW